VGARQLITTCSDLTYNDVIYADGPIGDTPPTGFAQNAFDINTKCSDITIDGLSFSGLAQAPYSSILGVNITSNTNIKLRNLGTYSSPISAGSAPRYDVSWVRALTTATITSVAHGMKRNDTIYVFISTTVAAIPIGSKLVLSVPTADTFTIACTDSGASDGTLSYELISTAYLANIAGAGVAQNVKIQRCYIKQLRTSLWTADNSSKNIYFENCHSFPLIGAVEPQLNGYVKGCAMTHPMTAQTSTYGTHWFDTYTYDTTPTISGVGWSRSSTTASGEVTAHNLVTNAAAMLNVTASSDTAAIVLGPKVITTTRRDRFTFTCLNGGGSTGTMNIMPYNGRIGLLMNEATSDTSDQYAIESGVPGFTSVGSLYMPTIGQQVTFTTPYYVLGHRAFPVAEAVMAGSTISFYNITYAINKNNGANYGAFRNLYYNKTGGGGGGAGVSTFTVTDANGVEVGDYVWGTGIGVYAKVTIVDTGTNTITVDVVCTGAVSGTIRFNHLPSETGIDPSLGFKLKIRINTFASPGNTAITCLYVYTYSDDTARAAQYPLDTNTVTLTNLIPSGEIVAYLGTNPATCTEIDRTESCTTSWTFTQSYPTQSGYIAVCSLGYQNFLLPIVYEAADISIPIQQQLDRQYNNP
jgi:hypothetical protein